MFDTFTYRGRKYGADITSPFSLLAKIKDGKIYFVQFLEDTLELRERSVVPEPDRFASVRIPPVLIVAGLTLRLSLSKS